MSLTDEILGFSYFFLSLKPISWVLFQVLKMWEVNEPFPKEGVDAMAIISYAASRDKIVQQELEYKLTLISYDVLGKGSDGIKPDGVFGWGVFSGSNTSVYEYREKSKLLRIRRGSTQNIFIGPVTSSTDECEAILKAWASTGRKIHAVGVSSESAHSRRLRLVWQYFLPKYFPKAKLFFVCSNIKQEHANVESPMILQRYWQVWLLFNVFFYPLYRWFPGVAWFAKRNFHQASS